MITNVYTVFDRKVEAFMSPFMARNDAEASRMFTRSFEERNSSAIPFEDLELYYVSQWDDNIGQYGVPESEKLSVPRLVIRGRDVEAQSRKANSPVAATEGPHWDTQTR